VLQIRKLIIERNNGGGPSGIGGWPPISTWISLKGSYYPEVCHDHDHHTSTKARVVKPTIWIGIGFHVEVVVEF